MKAPETIMTSINVLYIHRKVLDHVTLGMNKSKDGLRIFEHIKYKFKWPALDVMKLNPCNMSGR